MSPLSGLLFDDCGNRMSSSHTVKPGNKRYRYYVSQALLKDNLNNAGSLPRLPATTIEEVIFETLSNILPDQKGISWKQIDPQVRTNFLKSAIKRIEVGESEIRISLIKAACDQKKIRSQIQDKGMEIYSDENDELIIKLPARIHKWCGEKVIETPASNPLHPKSHPNKTLIKAIAKAISWRGALGDGKVRSFAEMARKNNCTEGYVRHILKLEHFPITHGCIRQPQNSFGILRR
jgi:hypothetical protein